MRQKKGKVWEKKPVRITLVVLLSLGAVVVVWILTLAFRDPLEALPQADALTLRHEERRFEGGRELRYVTLNGGEAGEIRFILSLPDPLPEGQRFPLLILLGGLAEARANLDHLPQPGNNIVLAFQWPFPAYFPHEAWTDPFRLPVEYRHIMQTPGQIAAATTWIANQYPFIDRLRVSLLSFSLGVLPAPAAQRVLEENDFPVSASVFAYGGTPIGTLLASHPRFEPEFLRPVAAFAVNLLARPIDPMNHLPYLTGPFLIMYGTEDEYVPIEEAERLQSLTPEPKTVITLETAHMDVAEEQLPILERIVAETVRWLTEQETINPIEIRQFADPAVRQQIIAD